MTSEAVRHAWIELAPAEKAYERTRGGPYDFGSALGMTRLLGAYPGIGRAFGALFREVMFEPGALSRQEREMVAGVAAAAQDCSY
ncbi:MAG: carboxymuconolactone decarboxylase family protein [Dehalococcoidia bacterium]